jgi:hypothetical protein
MFLNIKTIMIGIIGKRRSGKDTTADYIQSNYGYEKKKFAGPLKDAVEILFDFSKDQLETDKKDEIDSRWGVSPRTIMQSMGTTYLQYELSKIIPNIDRNYAIKRMFLNNSNNNKIVISDVRFTHEADEIKKRNGILIKIIRDQNNTNLEIDNHISECGVDNLQYDYLIYNNSTIEDLYTKINKIMPTK